MLNTSPLSHCKILTMPDLMLYMYIFTFRCYLKGSLYTSTLTVRNSLTQDPARIVCNPSNYTEICSQTIFEYALYTSGVDLV